MALGLERAVEAYNGRKEAKRRNHFRENLSLARTLKEGYKFEDEKTPLSNEDVRAYLEIANNSRFLGKLAKLSPYEFKKVVDDYRLCQFDDEKIVDEFGFIGRRISPLLEDKLVNKLGIASAGMVLGSIALSIAQRKLGIEFIPDTFLKIVYRSGETGVIIAGGTYVMNGGFPILNRSHTGNRIERIANIANTQRQIIRNREMSKHDDFPEFNLETIK